MEFRWEHKDMLAMEVTCTALGFVPIFRKHCCSQWAHIFSVGQQAEGWWESSNFNRITKYFLMLCRAWEERTSCWRQQNFSAPSQENNFMPPIEPRFNPCILPIKWKGLTTPGHLIPVNFLLAALQVTLEIQKREGSSTRGGRSYVQVALKHWEAIPWKSFRNLHGAGMWWWQ